MHYKVATCFLFVFFSSITLQATSFIPLSLTHTLHSMILPKRCKDNLLQKIGFFSEHLARNRLRQEFSSPNHIILPNICTDRSEIDAVVLDLESQEILAFAEVKGWLKYEKGIRRGTAQLIALKEFLRQNSFQISWADKTFTYSDRAEFWLIYAPKSLNSSVQIIRDDSSEMEIKVVPLPYSYDQIKTALSQ